VLKIEENSNKYKYATYDFHRHDLQVKLGFIVGFFCHAERSEASSTPYRRLTYH
jgi:hypothetical protein